MTLSPLDVTSSRQGIGKLIYQFIWDWVLSKSSILVDRSYCACACLPADRFGSASEEVFLSPRHHRSDGTSLTNVICYVYNSGQAEADFSLSVQLVYNLTQDAAELAAAEALHSRWGAEHSIAEHTRVVGTSVVGCRGRREKGQVSATGVAGPASKCCLAPTVGPLSGLPSRLCCIAPHPQRCSAPGRPHARLIGGLAQSLGLSVQAFSACTGLGSPYELPLCRASNLGRETFPPLFMHSQGCLLQLLRGWAVRGVGLRCRHAAAARLRPVLCARLHLHQCGAADAAGPCG